MGVRRALLRSFRLQYPKSADAAFAAADFDCGTNCALAVSAPGGARARYHQTEPHLDRLFHYFWIALSMGDTQSDIVTSEWYYIPFTAVCQAKNPALP